MYAIVWGETCSVDIFETKEELIEYLKLKELDDRTEQIQDFINGKFELNEDYGPIPLLYDDDHLNWICKVSKK